MSDKELMKNVPDSYDDFVNSMVRWMSRDASIRNKILELLDKHPESTTSDILKVLCDCLGIGDPIELINDDELVGAGSKSIYHIFAQ